MVPVLISLMDLNCVFGRGIATALAKLIQKCVSVIVIHTPEVQKE